MYSVAIACRKLNPNIQFPTLVNVKVISRGTVYQIKNVVNEKGIPLSGDYELSFNGYKKYDIGEPINDSNIVCYSDIDMARSKLMEKETRDKDTAYKMLRLSNRHNMMYGRWDRNGILYRSVRYDPVGNYFTCTFWHNNKEPRWIFRFDDKTMNKIGISIYYYLNGSKECFGYYKKGLKHGTWTYYESDGKVKKIEKYEYGEQLD